MTNLIKAETMALKLDEQESQYIYDLIERHHEIEAELETLKEGLKTWMEKNEIKKAENDYLSLSYIEGNYREVFDTKAFRKDHEDLYNQYIRFSDTKPQVRIKLK